MQTPNISITPFYTKKTIKLKSILTNLKKPASIFCLSPFSNIFKKYTYKSLKNLAQFFAYLLFKY